MIAMLILRPLLLSGVSMKPGETVKVEPLMANQMRSTGRAKLVDLADLAVLMDAEQRNTDRVCKAVLPRGSFAPATR